MDNKAGLLQISRTYVYYISDISECSHPDTVCNTVKKCVFVRVVDSCAGCAKGSKHVDLTQAAFKELADLGTGILQVQMRQATDPDGWCVDIQLLS